MAKIIATDKTAIKPTTIRSSTKVKLLVSEIIRVDLILERVFDIIIIIDLIIQNSNLKMQNGN
jgi:hypothetical protein